MLGNKTHPEISLLLDIQSVRLIIFYFLQIYFLETGGFEPYFVFPAAKTQTLIITVNKAAL